MPTAHAKVIVVGGDPLVGEALEVLLQAAGYRARFLPESAMNELGELLVDCRLLLIAPVLSPERRKNLLETMSNPTSPSNIPVLELLPANADQQLLSEHTVLWPCSGEELKRAIDALLDRGEPGPAGSRFSSPRT